MPDYDYRQDVLSFGDSVEVVEPKSLRKSMVDTINNLNKLYNNGK